MKRAHDDDYPDAKRLSKHVLQDRQRKLRLVRAGTVLEDHIPIPDVRTLILAYSNEFDGVTVMARDQERAFSLLTVWMGCLVSVSGSRAIVWDLDTRAPKLELVGHTNGIRAFAVCKDQLASGSSDATIRVWQKDGTCSLTIRHTQEVCALTYLDNGQLASGSDSFVHVWDTTHGTCVFSVSYRVGFIVAAPRGILVAASSSGAQIDMFDVASNNKLGHFDMPGALAIRCLSVLPDGQIVSGSWNGDVLVWQPEKGLLSTCLGSHAVTVAVLQASGQLLASGSRDGIICVWDTSRHMRLFTLEGHTLSILALAFLPDGKLMSSSSDETIRGWDVSTGQCVITLKTGWATRQLVMLPDCKLGAGNVSVGSNRVHVWA